MSSLSAPTENPKEEIKMTSKFQTISLLRLTHVSSIQDSSDHDQRMSGAEIILQERKSKGKKEYLIRWKGKGPESDSWEPASTVPQKVVRRFSSPKKTPKKSRSRSTSRSRRGRSKSKGRTPSKSPSRRRSAPGGSTNTRQSRRSAAEAKAVEAEVRTETITSKTETLQDGEVKRIVREETVVTTKKSPVSQSEPAWRPIPDLRKCFNSDYAVIIVFTCVVIITLSFVLENNVNWGDVWNYIKNFCNSLVVMMTSVFPTGSQQAKKD